jgi:membrane-bound lytic murein transglycosylase A
MRPRLFLSLLFGFAIAAGLLAWWLYRPGDETAPLQFEAVSFGDLPDWQAQDASIALAAFRRSCTKLAAKPDVAPMAYAGNVDAWRAACADAAAAHGARGFFESHFTPYAIGSGLVTGYYEPLLHGSRVRHGKYQTPVYALPDDLVTIDLGAFGPQWTGEHVTGRLNGHRLAPYPARAQIDAHPPSARVLFYGDDPIAVFFLHIQGSGRVALDDGTTVRVNYAGQNGKPYTAIGRTLIAQGQLTRANVSMQSIRAWLLGHPGQARAVMESDASFVFFKEAPVGDPALGADGTQGVPLTPDGSVAVDLHQHPLGVPLFIAGHGLFVAQDTGGAIKGGPRADIFFGFGPKAEDAAGVMKDHAAFYALVPKGVVP